jgi:hypothetical protein
VLAQVLGNLVRTSLWLDDVDAARAYLDEVLPLTRETGDERALMFILRQAGNLQVSDRTLALPFYEESLALARKLGDLAGEAAALNSIGNMHQHQGELGPARTAYEASVLAASRVGDGFMEAIARENLGVNFTWEGKYAEAEVELDRARQLSRQLRLHLDEASAIENHGFLSLHRGDAAAARADLHAALRLYREQGDVPATLLLLLAVLEAMGGEHRRALSWAGLALARGPAQRPQIMRQLEHFMPIVRGGLTDAEVEQAMEAGSALDLAAVFDDIAARPATG